MKSSVSVKINVDVAKVVLYILAFILALVLRP